MARASYSTTPLLRSLVHRPQGVILVKIYPCSPVLARPAISARRGAGSLPRRAAITFRSPWTAKEQKGADETYSLDVKIPGLQPHGESCDGRRLPKFSGIREEYILE